MKDFEDKIVLITGGTGSFGTALLKKFIHTGIMDQLREIRIFSRDELKQDMMRNEFNIKKIKYYIGDVRNRASVDQAMQNVNFVFHAAALKQVPSVNFSRWKQFRPMSWEVQTSSDPQSPTKRKR